MFTRLLLFVCCFRYCVLCVCIGGGGSTVSTVDVVCFVSDVGFAVIGIVFVVAVVFIYIFLILLLLLMLLWCLVIAGVLSAAVADAYVVGLLFALFVVVAASVVVVLVCVVVAASEPYFVAHVVSCLFIHLFVCSSILIAYVYRQAPCFKA